MDDYLRWEAKKAELDNRMATIQSQFGSATTKTQQKQLERQFNSLAKQRQKISSFVDWRG